MDTKERLVKNYIELVVKKKSSKISVTELCEKSNISRTTFYKYFKDTYDILEFIVMQNSIEMMTIGVKENLSPKAIVESWYISFYRSKEFFIYAINDDSQNSLFNTLITKIAEFNKVIFKGLASNEDIEYYAYKYATMQAMLLKKWLSEGMKVSPEKMTEYFLSDLLSGQ